MGRFLKYLRCSIEVKCEILYVMHIKNITNIHCMGVSLYALTPFSVGMVSASTIGRK